MEVLLTSLSDSAIAGEEDMSKDVSVDRVVFVPDSVDGSEKWSWKASGVEQSVVLYSPRYALVNLIFSYP